MRRFTRLTNAPKKLENLTAAVALHFAYYNFVRPHDARGKTPAMAAGLTDHVWSLDELIGLLDEAESYRPRAGVPQDARAEGGTARRDFKLSHYRHGLLTSSLRIRNA